MYSIRRAVYLLVLFVVTAFPYAQAQDRQSGTSESMLCRFGSVMCNCPKNVELEEVIVPQIIYTKSWQTFDVNTSMELSLFFDKEKITAKLEFIPPQKDGSQMITKEKPLKFIEQDENGRAIFRQDFRVPFVIENLPVGTWQYSVSVNCNGREMVKRNGLFELKEHP